VEWLKIKGQISESQFDVCFSNLVCTPDQMFIYCKVCSSCSGLYGELTRDMRHGLCTCPGAPVAPYICQTPPRHIHVSCPRVGKASWYVEVLAMGRWGGGGGRGHKKHSCNKNRSWVVCMCIHLIRSVEV